MSKKRKLYSPQFNAKLVIEAIQGQKTTPELASQYDIYPTMINTWKRQLLESASELFDKGKTATKAQSDRVKHSPNVDVQTAHKLILHLHQTPPASPTRGAHLPLQKFLAHLSLTENGLAPAARTSHWGYLPHYK